MAACIRGPRGQEDSLQHSKSPPQHKSIVQIYTDWGNHYLEKARSKRLISDLQADLVDGVLLADLIEAVTNQKVPDVQRKPKTASQMVDNIRACLNAADRLGVRLEGVTARDLREGSLKAILALFFSLSKHKQQLKLQAEQSKQRKHDEMLSRLPTPYQSTMGPGIHSSIPTPMSFRHNQPVSSPLKCPSTSSSRSTSPSHSFIPTPRTSVRSSLNEKQVSQSSPRVASSRNPNAISSPYNTPNKNGSMLDKFKLFNPKDKPKTTVGSTKRTSSSSGFSSAKSERSDSSTSLHNEPKPSQLEKKELSQIDAGKVSNRKKVVRVDTKLVRPSRSLAKPHQQQQRRESKEEHRPVFDEPKQAVAYQRPPSSEAKEIPPQQKPQEVEEQKEDNPPPPPAPTSNMETVEPLRVAGGSCIPKPTAIVKGYSKPTHTVAPMPPRQEPSLCHSLEKEKLEAVLEVSHERQSSVEEVEEAMANVKPMQPLLPGYNKRTVSISPRTIPPNRSRAYRPLDTYPRSNTERNFMEVDFANSSVNSGYLSDGEVLQSKCRDIPDGYLSEGGCTLYQRIQEHRGVKAGSNFIKDNHLRNGLEPKNNIHNEINSSRKCGNAELDLSGTEGHHLKSNRIVNGRSGDGGRGEGPPSPAQPHPVVYRVIGSRHIKKADSSQQTDTSAFRQVCPSNQWKSSSLPRGDSRSDLDRREVEGRSREKRSQQPSNGVQRKQDKKRSNAGSKEELDVDYCNEERTTKGGSSSGSSSSSSSGSKSKNRGVPPTFGYVKRSINGSVSDSRTAQVAGVPRTKVKVSGGTQTEYSLSPQLSAGTRERLMMASPKPRHIDGSLSDSNYAEISSPYGSWLRHSGAYTASLPARTTNVVGAMIEAESIESLPAQLHHRASLTHARLIGSPATAPRLSRSNSISYLRDRTFPRSTKSEKLYPSMLQRSEEVEPYYSIPYNIGVGHHHSSQPTSPTPSQLSQGAPNRFNYPISPVSSSPSSHGMSRNYIGIMTKMNSKDDDVHGSAVSLVSTASSLYSTPEEKQAHEVRKLRKELSEAQEKVHTLTNQLSTNAHVVSAFEQSLSNMTQRLQQLTATAEKKDSELLELRQTIELLRKQSVEAGLTSQAMSPSLARRHTINTTDPTSESNISRQLSTDSVSSLNSLSSACSLSSTPMPQETEKKKKRGWLRSSFNKAFSRSKKNRNGSVSSDAEDKVDISAPPSPLLGHHHVNGNDLNSPTDNDKVESGPEVVEELRKQLREKDLVLTDIRLEALSSAHQLESLKDTVIKMRNEMVNLKQDNERLQRLVTSKSLTSSQSSLPRNDSLERRFSMNDAIADSKYDVFASDPDGKRVTLTVFLGCHGSYHRYVEDGSETAIASLSVSGKTKWEMLDAMVRRAFKDYLDRVDPMTCLGLGPDSVWSYHVGEVVRYRDPKPPPELLPCGYLVGEDTNIRICLRGALHQGALDALAFDTLIPKSIIQRYVSLLTDYRRIILCGPSGTGKSYLANKLAEFLVTRAGKESTAESVATFNVEHKSSKELRQYLSNIAEQCETNAADLPSVIILDNLHQASSLGEVFNGFLKAKHTKCPYIIGTMNQATCSTTNLQLHHNFRWILCANHMEPVKGFLGRYLRRRLVDSEARMGSRSPELARIMDWVPRAWHHLNQFLEGHSSSDVTIGPRLFLSCPMDIAGSQVWFTDLWNYSVVPYLLEAVREGIQVYGRRCEWEDPAGYVIHSYPWAGDSVHLGPDALIRLRPEDVGYEVQATVNTTASTNTKSQATSEPDPLLNMLMRLQEAANYSSPHNTEGEMNSTGSLGVES
ncbi:protein sickie isoform X3 [Halyomorpha halys]|uniref:protein sickie isoform X3 n=1 Tax=Halyomorpha halys TaxID=286706 RepID=UPI0006D4D48E